MSLCRIDHLAVTAPSLEAGSAFVQLCLGVAPQPGGVHPRMGTHNRLLRLGAGLYLEVIAVQPGAPDPGRPRWFGLDDLAADALPRLGCWIARTDDLPGRLAAASEPLGSAEAMSRGALHWQISIPGDGVPPLGGVAPALIQWDTTPHPAEALPDLGCQLLALELRHPDPARVQALLRTLDLADPAVAVSVVPSDTPGLRAHIATPQGLRWLGD